MLSRLLSQGGRKQRSVQGWRSLCPPRALGSTLPEPGSPEVGRADCREQTPPRAPPCYPPTRGSSPAPVYQSSESTESSKGPSASPGPWAAPLPSLPASPPRLLGPPPQVQPRLRESPGPGTLPSSKRGESQGPSVAPGPSPSCSAWCPAP